MTDIDTLAVQASLEEYAHPELYDLENQPFEPDGPFFLALAQQIQGPVLERYGDWDGSPLSKESRLMIYVCAKRYNPL